MTTRSIPRRTQMELANPAAPGGRHAQMITIAVPLIGDGLSPEAVFVELRGKYDHTVTDAEICGVIKWAQAKNPRPSGYGNKSPNSASLSRPAQQVTQESAVAAVERFLKGFRCDEADLWHASPWRPLEDWRMDALMLFAGLFLGNEHVNIVAEHIEGQPMGAGATLYRDEWMRHFREQGIPQCPAGAWLRFNPVLITGSGKGGAICDSDVTAYRFLLIESDKLPIELQVSFLGKLSLPLAALIATGGKSIHALVRMDCIDADEYHEQSGRILKKLRPYGFDTSTRNPSRMTRLPGAIRQIGGKGAGEQRLLFFNPDAVHGERIFP